MSDVKSCNYHTRAIRHIRHLLTQLVAQTLACSLVNSQLDYCNSLLLGAPAMSLSRCRECRIVQLVCRVVMDAHRHTDAKPLLRQLHWSPVRQIILFKMAVLTRKAHTTGTHTSASIFINAPQLTPHVRHHPGHCLPFRTRQLCLHAELLTTQHRQHGTVFLQTF